MYYILFVQNVHKHGGTNNAGIGKTNERAIGNGTNEQSCGLHQRNRCKEACGVAEWDRGKAQSGWGEENAAY